MSSKKSRCWKGYEPVPGKKPYSPDSCRKAREAAYNGAKKALKERTKKGYDKGSAYAICTKQVGRDDAAKYERCVKKVKKSVGVSEEKKGKMPKMKMGVHKSREGGLTKAGVAAYRSAKPGRKLKTTDTTPTSKLTSYL